MLNASTVEAGAAIRFVATFVDAYGKKELHVEITPANELGLTSCLREPLRF